MSEKLSDFYTFRAIVNDSPMRKMGAMEKVDVRKLIGENFARILRERGIRPKHAADMIGTEPTNISRWKSGERGMSPETIKKICEVFGISPDELYRQDTSAPDEEYIPVVSQVQAGPNGHWEDAFPVGSGLDKIRRPPDLTGSRSYGLRVAGDSMAPKYMPGQIVVVDPQKVAVAGDYVVARLAGGEVMVKRYRPRGDVVILENVNPAYEPVVAPVSEIIFLHKIVWSKEK